MSRFVIESRFVIDDDMWAKLEKLLPAQNNVGQGDPKAAIYGSSPRGCRNKSLCSRRVLWLATALIV